MRDAVLAAFQEVYRRPAEYLVRAPARANLIGEHTDYNDGFVMPMAVDRALWLALAPGHDDTLRVHSLDFGGEMAAFSLAQLQDDSLPHWSKHVRGGWWLAAEKGYSPPGADVLIGSDIPIGAGMSSSAAIGVAVIEAILALAGDTSNSQIDKALLAVELEHKFIGVPCGVMDQIASAAGLEGSAMLLDCRSLEINPVHIPDGVQILVMDTKVSRALADTAYAERRRECQEAATLLAVPALRDATLDRIEAERSNLGETRFHRARHVVTENWRTLNMREALEQRDLTRAGELLNASHASLRDEYEVSVTELDLMCGLAQSQPSCYGARMMGGGFGGSAVALVRANGVAAIATYLEEHYAEETGLSPSFYVCSPSSGSGVEYLPAS